MGGDRFLFGMDKDQSNLAQLDPWELPPCFLLRNNKSKRNKSLRTYSGYWKEKEDELTAIRSGDGSSSSAGSPSPSYIGLRRTLEFYLNDGTRGGEGTRTDWIIHEYHHLRREEDATQSALFLEEDVVLRKVFKKCKGKTDDYAKHDVGKVRDLFYDLEALHTDDLRAHCKPQAKSDNVWKHFTKICSTNDPDEVYAACHRCDRVLKAHPKKHGTSHLTRHIHTCSSCTNPSTDEDRDMLRRLRRALHPDDERQDMGEKLACQDGLAQLDPWHLEPTPCYVTRSLNRQTHGGFWKEINKEFTCIRIEQRQMQGSWMEINKEITTIQTDQLQLQAPQYIGLRRTLVFHHQNGIKGDWIMLEYQQLDSNNSPALLLQGAMVIRKVFRYDKDVVDSAYREMGRWLNADDDGDGEYCNGEGVNTDTAATMSSDYMNGGGGDRKRKRTCSSNRKSEVWMYFTEIGTTDRDVVYAVCHYCDRGYGSGRSTNGTTHLWRHKKMCSRKHPAGTGSVNDANTTAWEAAIWPLLLLFKNSGEAEHPLMPMVAPGLGDPNPVLQPPQAHGVGNSADGVPVPVPAPVPMEAASSSLGIDLSGSPIKDINIDSGTSFLDLDPEEAVGLIPGSQDWVSTPAALLQQLPETGSPRNGIGDSKAKDLGRNAAHPAK